MTHQPGVYVPLRALFLVKIVKKNQCHPCPRNVDDHYFKTFQKNFDQLTPIYKWSIHGLVEEWIVPDI